MSATTKKPTPPKKEPLKADYRGATPQQVGKAVLTYKPKTA